MNSGRMIGCVAGTMLALATAGAEPVGLLYKAVVGHARTQDTPARRERSIGVDVTGAARLAVGDQVRFDLFPGTTLTGTVRSARDAHGFREIHGHLSGDPDGTFLIIAGRGVATMEVRSTTAGSFEVRHTSTGGYVVRELDDAGWKPCGCGREHEVGGGPAPGGHQGPGGYEERGTPVIRVLVMYTPLARDDEGGDAAIESRVAFALSQANAAYIASQADVQLELAYTGVIDYVESGSASTDLGRWRSTTDGIMDRVHCIRDAVGADMCALLVNNFNACGIAYIMTNVGPGFQSSAFSVTDKDCIGGYTFAHELGHNMGCAHDRDNAGNAAYSYAYGYRTPDAVYRTILAYSPGTRIGRFSNPNISFNGYVLGNPLGQADETYNALGITNTAPVIAAFRTGGALSPDYNDDGNVDQDDILCLVQAVAGDPSCSGGGDPDYTRDGNVDQDDVAQLTQLVAGAFCP
ncbi:MAG: M12 family metallo-peptidase [Planctomycetota bacterium]|nr:M12 family metallo-peptidase [Planctomycetota bacterium]